MYICFNRAKRRSHISVNCGSTKVTRVGMCKVQCFLFFVSGLSEASLSVSDLCFFSFFALVFGVFSSSFFLWRKVKALASLASFSACQMCGAYLQNQYGKKRINMCSISLQINHLPRTCACRAHSLRVLSIFLPGWRWVQRVFFPGR